MKRSQDILDYREANFGADPPLSYAQRKGMAAKPAKPLDVKFLNGTTKINTIQYILKFYSMGH